MKTLAEVTRATGFAVLEHLEAEAQVPVLGGLQAQGDLFIVPQAAHDRHAGGVLLAERRIKPVPAAGIAVIEAIGSGHEHRLFAGTPGTAWWTPADRGGQDLGVLECAEPAFILHPEHGAAGIAPGTYLLRRQREQADEERLVAD
jgi:hypothetical protein